LVGHSNEQEPPSNGTAAKNVLIRAWPLRELNEATIVVVPGTPIDRMLSQAEVAMHDLGQVFHHEVESREIARRYR
jgi:hypothetical protein